MPYSTNLKPCISHRFEKIVGLIRIKQRTAFHQDHSWLCVVDSKFAFDYVSALTFSQASGWGYMGSKHFKDFFSKHLCNFQFLLVFCESGKNRILKQPKVDAQQLKVDVQRPIVGIQTTRFEICQILMIFLISNGFA